VATLDNALVSADTVGTREDLIDKIYRVARDETPLTSNNGRRTDTNILFDWQTDEQEDPDQTNYRAEGNEFDPQALEQPTRLSNICQISDKAFRISGTQQALKKAGRKSDVGYQYAKGMLELRRDVVAILLSNKEQDLSVPRQTAPFLAYIISNINLDAGGANPTGDGSDSRTDSANTRPFTEAQVKDVLAQIHDSGGKPDMVMLGTFNKQAASEFEGIAEHRRETGNKRARIIAAADMYVGDFGDVSFVPNYLQRPRDAWVLDSDALRIAFFRPYERKNLGPFGDTAAEVLTTVEYGAQVDNEKAIGLVADLNSTLAEDES
jgi:hypothetical protein